MGAMSFTQIIHGATLQQAYEAAVQQALWEYGHDPYNGSISTTEGIIETAWPTPTWTPGQALRLIRQAFAQDRETFARSLGLTHDDLDALEQDHEELSPDMARGIVTRLEPISPPAAREQLLEVGLILHDLPLLAQGVPGHTQREAHLQEQLERTHKWGPCRGLTFGPGRYIAVGWVAI